jgi:hypothetical protein
MKGAGVFVVALVFLLRVGAQGTLAGVQGPLTGVQGPTKQDYARAVSFLCTGRDCCLITGALRAIRIWSI